jgi:O-antigen/teichoic acid export membrane protein
MASDKVQKKMARGALWMILLTFVDRTIALISTLILVRVLSPADFGIVAMALSFIFLAQLISAFGFDVALIHNRDATEDHYHTAWTLNVIMGTVIVALVVAAASPVARFYGQPEVFWVVCALGLSPFIGGFENIGVVAFRKDLDFQREFAFQISRKIVGFVVVVPLALTLGNHWALVCGTLAARLSGTLTSYYAHPFRPRLCLSQARALLSFSKWLLLNNVLILLKDRSSDFVIGRLSGPAALGVFNIAREFSNLPTTEIGAPINRALLPGFATYTDSNALAWAYFNAISMVAMVAIPAAAGTLAVAPFFVPTVLGEKWISGIPLMEVMAVGSAFLMLQASICSILFARGEAKTVMKTNVVFVGLMLLLLLTLTPRFGAIGAAWASLVSASVTMPLFIYQLRVRINVPVRMFLRAVARPALASLVMVAAVRAVIPDYTEDMSTTTTALWLATGVLVGAVTYVAAIATLWLGTGKPDGAERHVFELARARVSRLVAADAKGDA